MAFKQMCEYQSGGEIKRKLTGPTREPEGIILELSFMRLATSSALVFPLHAQDIVSVHGRNRYPSQRRQYVQGSPRKPTLVLETFLPPVLLHILINCWPHLMMSSASGTFLPLLTTVFNASTIPAADIGFCP
jgi:hypothetical protein